jgi:competence CoiA-like predicted nuclease
MDAKSAAEPLLRVANGLRKGFSLLVARVKALRRAVRVDNFRLAQRLRMALPLYVRHLTEPVRYDIVRLFEVSGLWVRNVGDRRQTKRNTLRIIRRIIQQLDARSDSWKLKSGLSATSS